MPIPMGEGPGHVAIRNLSFTKEGKLTAGLERVGPELNHEAFVGIRPLMRLAVMLEGKGVEMDGDVD